MVRDLLSSKIVIVCHCENVLIEVGRNRVIF
jgi:hypothetical protein